MPKFRKKPVVVEAVQWVGDNIDEIRALHPRTSNRSIMHIRGSDIVTISTLEGLMRASINDWIIKGVEGELYPCKPKVFEKIYEPVEEE